MDSADSIPDSAWAILDTITSVPAWQWAAGAVIGFFGILVLVFPFSDISFNGRIANYPQSNTSM